MIVEFFLAVENAERVDLMHLAGLF